MQLCEVTHTKQAKKKGTICPSQKPILDSSNGLRRGNSIESRIITFRAGNPSRFVYCTTHFAVWYNCGGTRTANDFEEHLGGSQKKINSILSLLHLQGDIAVQLYCVSHLNHFLAITITATSGTANIYIYSQIDPRYKSTGPSGPLRGPLYVQKDCTREWRRLRGWSPAFLFFFFPRLRHCHRRGRND